jgi:hypothetical protein
MSSTLTHALTDSIAAIIFAKVQPNETTYIMAALVSASIVDLDHLVFIIRDREMYRNSGYNGNLHHARSVFHELIGLLLVAIVASILYFWDQKLAFIVFIAFTLHLVQDWLLGKSHPFTPLSNVKVEFLHLNMKQKVVIDLVLMTIGGALWLMYLSGHL